MGVFMDKMKFSRRLSGLLTAALLAFAAAGCSSSLYDDMENWAVNDGDTPEFFAEYDVFYLYPSYRKDGSRYLNWMESGVADGIRRSVLQPLARQFGPRVRIYSPFIPQLTFEEYNALLKTAEEKNWKFDWSDTPLDAAIKYTVMALERYMDSKDVSHPFVLQGYGQGALVLYEAMKRCPAIKPKNGFVAAYLFGLPGVTPERIADDFGSRGIRPASDRTGIGVIAVCNIRPPGIKLEDTLALHGGAVINPINWRVDATPAPPKDHAGAMFVGGKSMNPARRIRVRPAFCGAVVDTENALVDLTNLPRDFNKMPVPRSFDPQLAWVFGMCVSRNAGDRVRAYKFKNKGLELPENK